MAFVLVTLHAYIYRINSA